jgi:hypothetical protein
MIETEGSGASLGGWEESGAAATASKVGSKNEYLKWKKKKVNFALKNSFNE